MNTTEMQAIAEFSTERGKTVATAFIEADRKLLHVQWNWNYDDGVEVIKQAAMGIVDIIAEHKLKGAMADLRKVNGNWDPINDWIIGSWLPAVQEAGATHWIHVQPEEFFAGLSAELLEEGFMLGGLKAQNVKTVEDGQSWWDKQM